MIRITWAKCGKDKRLKRLNLSILGSNCSWNLQFSHWEIGRTLPNLGSNDIGSQKRRMSWQPETCLLLVAELRSAATDSRLRNSSLKQSSTKPWNFTRFKKSLKTFVFRRDTNYSQSLMRLRAYLRYQVRSRLFQLPIQSNVNKRAQVFLFPRIFYNITFTYKLKHLRFQLTRNENCKEHLDQASVCLDDFWKY